MSHENDETQEQTPAGVGAMLEDTTPGSGALRCPQCGGRRIRKRFYPLLVNLALIAMLLVLAQVGRVLYQIAPMLSWGAGGFPFDAPCYDGHRDCRTAPVPGLWASLWAQAQDGRSCR